MAKYFQHPVSGSVVKATGEFSWLWAFLFGPFYFGYKGLWGHAVLYVLAAIVTFCVSWFIYPFFAKGIVVRRYLDMGWREVSSRSIQRPTEPMFVPPPLPPTRY